MKINKTIIVLDAADVGAESTFWAGLLGGEVHADPQDDWHSIVVDGEWKLGVQLAPGHVAPTWPAAGTPQQIHFDLYVDDLAASDAETVALGGRMVQAAEDPDADEGFQVYLDPAGHPFCLCWDRRHRD